MLRSRRMKVTKITDSPWATWAAKIARKNAELGAKNVLDLSNGRNF